MDKKIIRAEAKDYIGITFGLVMYAFGFTFFLMPYEIVTGGVAGIAAITQYATDIPNQYTYFLVNAALLLVGLKILGWKFLMKTIRHPRADLSLGSDEGVCAAQRSRRNGENPRRRTGFYVAHHRLYAHGFGDGTDFREQRFDGR